MARARRRSAAALAATVALALAAAAAAAPPEPLPPLKAVDWEQVLPGDPARGLIFPPDWPESRVRATVRSAYEAGRALPAEGEGAWCGCAGATTVFGVQAGGTILRAWPETQRACGCETIPLHRR